MARPKIDTAVKKQKMNITLTPEVREMFSAICTEHGCSASEWIQTVTIKEYKRIMKQSKAQEH